MNRTLKELIEGKNQWTSPPATADLQRGFKGWYASQSLPHFDAPGRLQYISYRLADSMPAGRRREWEALLDETNVRTRMNGIERCLDRGYGACHLRDPRVADLVQANWWHRDCIDYRLLAWVVMPNHVHLLVQVWHVPMGVLLRNWKGYTSKAANRILGRVGAFWAEDYFDRFIRDEDHLRRVVHYIEDNPTKPGLVRTPEEWPWSSARFRSHKDLSARTLMHLSGDHHS